jgi:hypothetical protein
MLEDSEWAALAMVASWLKMFREATVLMSTTKRPMLSSTHAIFRGLQAHIQDIITDLPSDVELELRDGLVASHLKLSEYFAKFDESAYCLWACRECSFGWHISVFEIVVVLDPRISYEGLRQDYASEPDLLSDLDTSKEALKDYFVANYCPVDSVETPDIPDDTMAPDSSPQKFDFTKRYRRHSPTSIHAELDDYFRVTSQAAPWEVDPLLWWSSRREQFPNLYRLARDILCVPGMFSISFTMYVLVSDLFQAQQLRWNVSSLVAEILLEYDVLVYSLRPSVPS